jgi:hypothetical protein
MLRFYMEKGRPPRGRSEIQNDAVEYMARQAGVASTARFDRSANICVAVVSIGAVTGRRDSDGSR